MVMRSLPDIPGIPAEKLLNIGSGLYAAVVIIRPATAEQWLGERQRKNRKLSGTIVARYARTMMAGDWRVNGEAIVFSEKGTLMNGQHRLTACVASREPLKVLVVVGVPDTDELMASYDGGLVRTGGQVLQLANYASPNVLSAMADIVYRYEMNLPTSSKVDSIARLHTVERHPEMSQYASMQGQANRSFAHFPGSLYAGLHYLFTRADEKKAVDFSERFIKGYNLESGSPVAALRTAANRSAQGRGRMAHNLWYQLIIKAWNAEWNGEAIRSGLRVGPRESKQPNIDGLPRVPPPRS